MEPIDIPTTARTGRPDCEPVRMGPPKGVSEESVGTARMLMSEPDADTIPGYTTRRFYAYFRPSDDELAMLNDGGFIEVAQYGLGVQPFGAAIWPPEHEIVPGSFTSTSRAPTRDPS